MPACLPGTTREPARRDRRTFAGEGCAAQSNFDHGKTTPFTRDSLGREVTSEVDPEGGQANRRLETTFWPSGARRKRVKSRAVDGGWSASVTDSRFYERDGRLSRRVRDPESGDPATTDYEYDDNGNRTQDERGTHAFNARDQLVRWNRRDGNSHVTYGVNGTGAITSKADTRDGSSMTYGGVGDRVESLTVSQGGATATFLYEHNALGSVIAVRDQAHPNDAESTVTYGYDAFNRLRRRGTTR
jgi:hypothetical protein